MSTITPCPVHPRVSDPSMRPAEEKPDTVIDIDEPIEKPQTQTNLEKVKGLFTSAWENKLIVFIIVLIVLIVGIIAYMLNKKSDTGEKSSLMDKIKNGFDRGGGKKPGGEQVAQYGGNAAQQQTPSTAAPAQTPARANAEQMQTAPRRQQQPVSPPTRSSPASPTPPQRQESTSSQQSSQQSTQSQQSPQSTQSQQSPQSVDSQSGRSQSSQQSSDRDDSGQPSHDTFMSMSADELQNLKKQRSASAAVAAAMTSTPPVATPHKPATNTASSGEDLNDYLKNEAMKPVADDDSDADLHEKPIVGPNPVEKNIISEIDAAIAPNFAAPMDAQAIDTNKAMIESMTTPSTTTLTTPLTTQATTTTTTSSDGKCTQLLSTGRYCKNVATKGNKCHHHA